jgi:ABC-type glycerol-3-phosphate transport system substrate-binding protein
MNSRHISVTAVAVVTAFGAAACGGSSSGGASGTNTPSASSSAGGLGHFNGQSFTILGQWTGEEQKAFQSVISGFDKLTGASGKYSAAAGGDEASVLGAKVNGGNPPDVAFVSLPGALQQYAKAGKLVALNSAAQQAVNTNYSKEWATLGSDNGKLYGVPFDASNKSTVWYNTKPFSDAGITSPPTDWPGFIKDAQTLHDSGVQTPISVGGGDGWTLTDWFENVYMRTAGTAMYDKLTQHQIKWTDPSVAKALTTLKQVWGNSNLIGSPSSALKVPFTGSVDNTFKANPSSAIVYEGSFVATTITGDKLPAKVGSTAKFFPFPSINGSQPTLVAGGDFAVAFSNKPVVQAFLQYVASPDAAQKLVSFAGSGFVSANKNLPSSAYPDSTLAQVAQQLVSVGDNFRFDMSDQEPAAFGGTPNKGEWADLQTFLSNGNVSAAQRKLEHDAAAAAG